ncbi:dual specificity protein phosphatase 22-A-like isoform X1 [Poecile atricapillus]|uniref:dual specificity protein phosphatase 22-A-like isoform X1 n=1 Tax=Poecile atricapillus TaxID=48891 RepID=UPI0027389CDB|nr:dual specificity protein phosphatase 22-A-like isoform X1 [Poecile atricapillus]
MACLETSSAARTQQPFLSYQDSEDHENLLRKGVTHILSVHNHAKPVLEDMTYLCISASDSSSQNLLQHFKECIQFIHECRLAGGGCLVHCLAGVSRSSTILVAYLMTVTELGWESCLAATKAVRSYVSPNPGFQQQLQEYERTLLQERQVTGASVCGNVPFPAQNEVEQQVSGELDGFPSCAGQGGWSRAELDSSGWEST